MVGVLVCASTAVSVGLAAPAAAFPGLVFVSATSPNNSNLGKVVSAACPPGWRVLGGGGSTSGPGPAPWSAGDVMIDLMRPVTTAAGDSYEVNASEAVRPDGSSYAGNWLVLAYAICGVAPAGLEYVSASSAADFATTSKSATATCSPGKRVIGTGGQVTPSFGHHALDGIVPNTSLTNVKVSAVQGEVASPFAWSTTAYAICANPLPGLTMVWFPTPSNSLDKSVTVQCPAGTKLRGVGADLVHAEGQIAPSDLLPNQALDTAELRVREDFTGVPGNWWARVFAICAT